MRLPESTLIIATFVTGILVANYLAPRPVPPPAENGTCAAAMVQEN